MTVKLLRSLDSAFFVALFVLGALALNCFGGVQPSSPYFNVKQYGAAGNGVRLDTDSINKAIQSCVAAGGGTVYFPAGTYLTGTIHLKSNVTLRLASGATILGTKDLSHYQWPSGKSEWFGALILASGVHNVAIVGHGTIDGNKVFNPRGEERMRGPHAALFFDSQDVTIRDVTFKDASNYAVIMRFCERVNIDGITVRGGWDGINMWYTKNATIANCRLFTGDDAMSGAYWENVTVTNCILNTSCNGFRVGGINVLINNCLIYGPGKYEHRTSGRHDTIAGFQILPQLAPASHEAQDDVVPPGPIDNMMISNVTMINVRSPVWIAYGSGSPYSRGNLGLRRIVFNNLTAIGVGKAPFYVSAPINNPAELVVVRDSLFTLIGGAREAQANGQGFSPFSILQAYGFYCRNVRRLELHNVRLNYQKKDLRPALFGENIGTIELDRFDARQEADGPPLLSLNGVGRVLLDGKVAPAARFQVKQLEVGNGSVEVDNPFPVTVTVKNPGSAALGKVALQLGSQTLERSVWLKAGETAPVQFVNTVFGEPGEYRVEAGGITKSVKVLAKPAAHLVQPPFYAFHNVTSTLQQLDNGFYIRAGGDYALLNRIDQYAAVYLKRALPPDGMITVKLENPDMRTGWGSMTGIIVRNDVAQPGKSEGYVILCSSAANGTSLRWDSNGDGRIDMHTELDGYTLWPHWLKLTRQQHTFVGYYCGDGKNWTRVGEAEVPGTANVQDAGVFVHSGSARFTDFKVISLTHAATRSGIK